MFLEIPCENELKQLSQKIVSTLRSEKKSDFKLGTSASSLRSNLAIRLGVPLTQTISLLFIGWTARGDAIEITRFCRFFEIWKTTSDQPVRIFLVAALLQSPVRRMIPGSLEESFSDGMQLLHNQFAYTSTVVTNKLQWQVKH